MYTLKLPYPPSVNHYWRYYSGRVCISKHGLAYRAIVAFYMRLAKAKTMSGPVGLKIAVYPPDRRRRDIDNVLKALLDALQHGGAFQDDYQVSRINIKRYEPCENGAVIVEICDECKEKSCHVEKTRRYPT